MKINTRQFGEIEIDPQNIIRFAEGMPGFEEEHNFVLLPYDEESPFVFLQSCESAEVAFLMTDPFNFFRGYEFELDDVILEELSIENEFMLGTYVILTITASGIQQITANLAAPVIINTANKLARQVILEKGAYTTKHSIFAEATASAPEGGE